MKSITLNGNFRINFASSEIENLSARSTVNLEPRLMQLLGVLIRNNGKVISREFLIEKVWGNYGSGNDYLNHSICLIRRSMDKSIIRTIPKKGYMLNAELVRNRTLGLNLTKITFSKAAAFLMVLLILKMIFFPHH